MRLFQSNGLLASFRVFCCFFEEGNGYDGIEGKDLSGGDAMAQAGAIEDSESV